MQSFSVITQHVVIQTLLHIFSTDWHTIFLTRLFATTSVLMIPCPVSGLSQKNYDNILLVYGEIRWILQDEGALVYVWARAGNRGIKDKEVCGIRLLLVGTVAQLEKYYFGWFLHWLVVGGQVIIQITFIYSFEWSGTQGEWPTEPWPISFLPKILNSLSDPCLPPS